MYIRGLIPRNSAESAEAVLIAEDQLWDLLCAANQLPGKEPTNVDESKTHHVMKKLMMILM